MAKRGIKEESKTFDEDIDEFLGIVEESDNYIRLDIQEANSTQTNELIIYEDYPSAKDFLSLVTCPKEPELDHFNFYEDHSYAVKMLSLGNGSILYLNSDSVFNDYKSKALDELSSDSLSNDYFENEHTYDYSSENESFTFPICNASEDEEIIASEVKGIHGSMTMRDSSSHSHTIANVNLLKPGKILTLKRKIAKTNEGIILKKKSNPRIYNESVINKDLPPMNSNNKIMSNEKDPLSLPCDDSFWPTVGSKPFKKCLKSSLKKKKAKRQKAVNQSLIEADNFANFQNSPEFNIRLIKNSFERNRRYKHKELLQDLACLVTDYDYSNKLPSKLKIMNEATKAINAYKEIDLERTKQIELKKKYSQLVKLVS